MSLQPNAPWLQRLGRTLSTLVWSQECACCGAWDANLCAQCLQQVSCPPHGLGPEQAQFQGRARLWGQVPYREHYRRLVLAAKHGQRDLAQEFALIGNRAARALAPLLADSGQGGQVWVVPAPGHDASGPNPLVAPYATGVASGLLAGGGAGQTLVIEAVQMAAGQRSQAGLSGWQRKENRRGVMSLRPELAAEISRGGAGAAQNISALVVDDVSATGATCAEMARVLAENGIKVLGALVFAYGGGLENRTKR